MISPDWARWYMALARLYAERSHDPSTKVGAVIISNRNRRWIVGGYNGFPPGIADTGARLHDRSLKYRYTVHAERNAMDNATFDVEGSTLVVTQHPCHECTKSIVSRGIARVICPPLPQSARERWGESSGWAAEMMREAGVELVLVEDVVVPMKREQQGD